MNHDDLEAFEKRPAEQVFGEYVKRFGWLSSVERETLKQGILFGQTCKPPINWYYWASLPRIVAAITWFAKWLHSKDHPNEAHVLDLGACQPIAALWWLVSHKQNLRPQFTYVAQDTEKFREDSALGAFETKTINVTFGVSPLPFPDKTFDFVVFTEVLEHLNVHPQSMLCEINRILKETGYLLLSTPNVGSWRKLYDLSCGNWGFDSPTFSGEWGHRYEYSCYQAREMLRRAGFDVVEEKTLDVNFDDAQGIASSVQIAGLLLLKLITGEIKPAAKMWMRRGSGMFVLARKNADVPQRAETMLFDV